MTTAAGVGGCCARRRRRGRPLGAGDCEAWGDGVLGQPTNTLTSAAYLVAGAWLAARSRRVPAERRRRVLVSAGVCGAAGVGSIAYHGIGGRISQVLHDGAIVLLVAWLPHGAVAPCPPDHAAAIGRRRRVALAATILGLVAYPLGRTGAGTCEPTSRWQWHGVWHVAGAVATAAWSDATDVLPYADVVPAEEATRPAPGRATG